MTHLDFTEVRPADYQTTPQQRLEAHLVRDLKRQFPNRKDVHFDLLASNLAAVFTMVAADVDIEAYSLKLKRPADLEAKFHNLADQ